MSGVLAALTATFRLLHSMSLTVGTSGGSKGYVATSFGSVDDDAYVDGTGVSRTIVELYWIDASDSLVLSIAGNNVPNLNSTFERLVIGSTAFYRAAAAYNGSSGANSAWTFSGVSADPFASSPVAVRLDGG